MKKHIILSSISILCIIAALFTSCCDNSDPEPMLGEPSSFISPELSNPETSLPVELLPENATETYEEFEWSRADYGIQLSVDYIIQIADNNMFLDAKELIRTGENSSDITVEKMNNAMLSLGLPGYEESTVYLRVKSVVNEAEDMTTVYSDTIARTATTYQTSECGNFCSMGIIGSATAGGWDVDTDMQLADPAKIDKYTWKIMVYLKVGAAKFRANDAWDPNNWGGSSFPDGTGSVGGGDISIPTEGYYEVTFNDNTLAYNFKLLSPKVFTTIGLIGTATPDGWDSDTDMTADADDPHLWTLTVTLTEGVAKFRADNDWADNWGGTDYPTGIGVGGGADIAVKSGTYLVRFHDITGEYMFIKEDRSTPYDEIGIIGSAQQPGDWTTDTDMIQNPVNPFLWSKTITLVDGEAKFRADNAWTVNWGSADFPGGIGVQEGPNIPAKSGTYTVSFNTGTGEYYFLR